MTLSHGALEWGRMKPSSLLSLLFIPLAFAQSADTGGSPPETAPGAVVEIAEFRLASGAIEAEFLKSSAGLDGFLRDSDGFVSRQLVRHDDGKFADLVTWARLESAHAAMTRAEKDPRAQAYFGFIAMETVSMRHAAVVRTIRR
jgi:hypothetical protein